MLDILLSAFIGVVVLGLAALGGAVASTQKWQTRVFWGLGIVGVALTVWQGVRTHDASVEHDRRLSEIGGLVRKMADNAPDTGHHGELAIQEGAVQATIAHGYDDPNRSAVVYPSVNWNTNAFPASQDRSSVTFVFNVPAGRGAMLKWKASKPER